MKLTKSKLQQIIKEEVQQNLSEIFEMTSASSHAWHKYTAFKKANPKAVSEEEDSVLREKFKDGEIIDINDLLENPWVKGRRWYSLLTKVTYSS